MTSVVQHVVDALTLGSLYALFALGIALIFGIMRLINFAHGELIMLAGYTIVLLAGAPFLVVVFGSIVVAVVAALLMDRVAFRPVRGANAATLLVTSFAVSFLVQNLLILTEGSTPKATSISTSITESVDIGGVAISRLDIVTVVATVVLLAALGAFLSRTTMGVQMRAAAENFDVARLMGVRADRVIATAFGISGVLAGVGALLLVAETGTVSPTLGLNPVLIAFVATVMGGLGTLTGAVLGGYVLGALTVVLQVALPIELRSYRDAIAYAIVILVLVARPQGLVVSRAVEARV
jgi:branched-chain amino acid transport system permease protein